MLQQLLKVESLKGLKMLKILQKKVMTSKILDCSIFHVLSSSELARKLRWPAHTNLGMLSTFHIHWFI